MDALLRALRNERMSSLLMPAHRFFTPTARFWSALADYAGIRWVDAGTGSGELPEEAREHGVAMLGLDLAPRQGASPHVLHADAELFDYNPDTWLLMCRPDHSGWAYPTLLHAQRLGAGAAYVGLERNRDLDLDDVADLFDVCIPDVGEDGEHLWLYRPGKLAGVTS